MTIRISYEIVYKPKQKKREKKNIAILILSINLPHSVLYEICSNTNIPNSQASILSVPVQTVKKNKQ